MLYMIKQTNKNIFFFKSKKGKESISLQTPQLARSLNNSFVQCWTRCSLKVILFLWFVFGRVKNRLDTDDRSDQV